VVIGGSVVSGMVIMVSFGLVAVIVSTTSFVLFVMGTFSSGSDITVAVAIDVNCGGYVGIL